MTLAAHALLYAEAGLEVFPVDPDTKRPIISQHRATTEASEIERWWERWPEALIGHRIRQDVVLLDIDPRSGGLETWRALKASMPDLGETRKHYSGRGDGGGHVWFLRPGDHLSVKALNAWAQSRGVGTDRGGRWTAGIDILHRDHRYTILPPSPHPDTRQPYRWKGGGLQVAPGPMPGLLAELLTTADPAPRANEEGDGYRTLGPAEWYSRRTRWSELLTGHGWSVVSGDGDEDGSEWRHPAATNEISATVRNRCLFVYSTSTGFEPTEEGDPHGYTPFAAMAVLEHEGSQSAAARAVRRRMPGGVTSKVTPEARSGASDTSDTGQSGTEAQSGPPPEHLERFWTARPVLTHIRDFARARRCSPWSMLGVVLARLGAAVPPFVVLPPLVGSHLSLNFYVVLVGPSGAGKDAAISAGEDAIDLSAGLEFHTIGLGSGEGLLDQYVRFRPPNKANDDPGGIEQHNRSVLFVNPEIETVGALKGRSSATLMPELRSAWTGKGLGFAYARQERRLYVGKHRYRLNLVIGAQPEHCKVLLEDESAGTPQRFVWLPATDPVAPDDFGDEPGLWEWERPSWPNAASGLSALPIAAPIADEIHAARLARLRGEDHDGLAGHALACREKTAALMAVLDGRADVSLTDWSLAGVVQSVSDRTRARAQAAIEADRHRENLGRAKASGVRKAIESEMTDEKAIQRTCERIVSRLSSNGDHTSRGDLSRHMGRDRDFMDEALDRLKAVGQVVETRQGRAIVYRVNRDDDGTKKAQERK